MLHSYSRSAYPLCSLPLDSSCAGVKNVFLYELQPELQISTSLTSYQENSLSSQHKCQPPPVLKGKWPLSLDLLVKCVQADNANQILRFFTSVLETTGYTHAQLLFGLRSINTVDPQNIEYILSTQFKGLRPSPYA